MGGAERLWWLLRHFGHDDCAVMELDGWHGPLDERRGGDRAGDASRLARVTTTRSKRTSSRDAATSSSSSTRGCRERWRGEDNPIDKKPGRIPGALNAPWNEPLPELPDGELVAYCGSGVTATVVLHRAHLAGREGKLYPGLVERVGAARPTGRARN